MATRDFEHLPLPLRMRAEAKLNGGGKPSPQTVANRGADRAAHVANLTHSSSALVQRWKQEQANRATLSLPTMPAGKPFLLTIDPSLDPDKLRHFFGLEVVAEQEDGFVLVATKDIEMRKLNELVAEFGVQVRGSATVAQVHKLHDEEGQVNRLKRLLSEALFQRWHSIQDADQMLVEIGIECVGTAEIPDAPKPLKRGASSDARWARRQAAWAIKWVFRDSCG